MRDAPVPQGTLFDSDFTLLAGYTTYPVLFFLAGMTLYGIRRHVVDRVAALMVTMIAFALPFDAWIVCPAACYAILALASDPVLERFRPRWDLSFGISMYGAAMGQVAFAVTGSGTPWLHVAITVPLAVLCSTASCLAVDRPFLTAGRFLSRLYRGLSTASRRLHPPPPPFSLLPPSRQIRERSPRDIDRPSRPTVPRSVEDLSR